MPVKDREILQLPSRLEWIAFGILIVTALLIRVNHISADPPIDLSISQAVYTDPAQYTSYARNLALWGSFNPLHDYRLVLFLKSATTVVSYLIFALFGVGYVQACLTGLVFSFATIVLLYLALRRMAGNTAALFFLILISLDYNQIFYGRLSFLENSLNFFAVLAFTLVLYGKRTYSFLLSGLFLAVGIFFGKVIGLIYLFPFACYIVWDYFSNQEVDRRRFFIRYGSFVAGFLIVLITWYFVSYRPMITSVEGYLQEQAFALYGAPEAFDDFNTFVYKYVSFGSDTGLFSRMIVPALLALAMILLFFYRCGFKKSWSNHLYGIGPGVVFLITLIFAAYGSLMIWNYRPLRYQTILIYPSYALAGIFLAVLISNVRTGLSRRGNFLFSIAFFVLILVPTYQFMRAIYNMQDMPFHFNETRSVLLVLSIIMTLGVILYLKFAPESFKRPPGLGKSIFVLVAVLLTLIPNSVRYLKWSSSASYAAVANSLDLETIISPEAVISGPYAAGFTLENKFRNFIHMFGVANVDSNFFRRYPVTHLLLDISNEKKAREDYPQIMEKAVSIFKYRIGGREIGLFRVAEATGNINARQYHLSPFETALYHYSNENIAGGNELMKLHLRMYPDNLSANLTSAILADHNGYYEDADYYFKKAIDFSPTDFFLRFKTGEFYIGVYNRTGQAEYREIARAQFDLALKYNPGSKKLVRDINKLMGVNESKGK